MENQSLPKRKHPVHGVKIDPGLAVIVFVTVCTKDRQRWLATQEIHQLLRDIWTKATAWRVGRYVILPDHLHLFAAPGEPELSLEAWIRYWKSQFTKAYGKQSCRWQYDHWDRRLRTGESYSQKWEYVQENPVRHSLVQRHEDWPFQGELFELPW